MITTATLIHPFLFPLLSGLGSIFRLLYSALSQDSYAILYSLRVLWLPRTLHVLCYNPAIPSSGALSHATAIYLGFSPVSFTLRLPTLLSPPL